MQGLYNKVCNLAENRKGQGQLYCTRLLLPGMTPAGVRGWTKILISNNMNEPVWLKYAKQVIVLCILRHNW